MVGCLYVATRAVETLNTASENVALHKTHAEILRGRQLRERPKAFADRTTPKSSAWLRMFLSVTRPFDRYIDAGDQILEPIRTKKECRSIGEASVLQMLVTNPSLNNPIFPHYGVGSKLRFDSLRMRLQIKISSVAWSFDID